jgi:hypothetical protein
MQSYPLKPHSTVPNLLVFLSLSSVLVPRFPLFSCVVISPGFRHGVLVGGEFLVFPDCFLCFTHVMGTLV